MKRSDSPENKSKISFGFQKPKQHVARPRVLDTIGTEAQFGDASTENTVRKSSTVTSKKLYIPSADDDDNTDERAHAEDPPRTHDDNEFGHVGLGMSTQEAATPAEPVEDYMADHFTPKSELEIKVFISEFWLSESAAENVRASISKATERTGSG